MRSTVVDRTALVQSRMAAEEFDVLLFCSPPNMVYVSGFRATPHERLIAIVVPPEGGLRAVVPSLEEDAACAALPAGAKLFAWRDEEGPAGALHGSLAGLGGRIGVEKSYLTVAFSELAVGAARGSRFDDCGELLGRLRAVKDGHELACLRRAAEAVDTAVTRLAAEELRPGRCEVGAAARSSRRDRGRRGGSRHR